MSKVYELTEEQLWNIVSSEYEECQKLIATLSIAQAPAVPSLDAVLNEWAKELEANTDMDIGSTEPICVGMEDGLPINIPSHLGDLKSRIIAHLLDQGYRERPPVDVPRPSSRVLPETLNPMNLVYQAPPTKNRDNVKNNDYEFHVKEDTLFILRKSGVDASERNNGTIILIDKEGFEQVTFWPTKNRWGVRENGKYGKYRFLNGNVDDLINWLAIRDNLYVDCNGVALKPNNVIDINQTVNGQNLFYVKSITPLDIRYNYDRSRKYEYSMNELLAPSEFTGETEFRILS